MLTWISLKITYGRAGSGCGGALPERSLLLCVQTNKIYSIYVCTVSTDKTESMYYTNTTRPWTWSLICWYVLVLLLWMWNMTHIRQPGHTISRQYITWLYADWRSPVTPCARWDVTSLDRACWELGCNASLTKLVLMALWHAEKCALCVSYIHNHIVLM